MTSFPRYSELLNEAKARRKICGWLVWGFDGGWLCEHDEGNVVVVCTNQNKDH